MKAKSYRSIFAWISLVLGVIAFLGSISSDEINLWTYFFEMVMIITGLVLLISPIGIFSSTFFIIDLIIFGLFLLVGLVVPLESGLALILILMGLIPLIFGILYAVKIKEENKTIRVEKLPSSFDEIDLEEKKIKAYDIGLRYFNEKEYQLSLKMFEKIRDYRDSERYIIEIKTILLDKEKESYYAKR
jgi:predicted membrane protein